MAGIKIRNVSDPWIMNLVNLYSFYSSKPLANHLVPHMYCSNSHLYLVLICLFKILSLSLNY